ncbi:PREDICTED: myb-binding protein 1A [Chrysochloris asiatica]|uniref:Myb-binding protein 1A n=1 Tax=Chrysochloris asiatica TaxID=185453 RepID=A0A9B0WQC1_CHRAS|nr:PREDICTED: myb-binding protein 1A [Chrysochloris asiatica]
MECSEIVEPVSPGEATKSGVPSTDRHDLLQHSREFLDFFWDIAKPEQETRLKATEKLLEYLRTRPKGSEMNYALKRLITGLGVGRETARPCYSLALAQLLQSFEDIPLCSILEQIQEKYDLQKMKKAMLRPALFAHLFGVLAFFQSGRLVKDQEALLKSVKLLQVLAQHHNHLQEQPQKALVDILSEVPEAMLKEILPKVLKADLGAVLSSPEFLGLFLLAQRKVPAKLEKLMGQVDLFSDENIPRLVDVLKIVAASVKKERKLPAVALDLLRLALQENKFPRFWNEVLEQGLLKKQFLPANFLCFRLLGASLPLLSKKQLQLVMRGDVIRLYGEHLVTAKLPAQFKFAPEMDEYVNAFLEGCRDDPEQQLAMLVAFSSVTNQGHPVVPTFWRVVQLLNPSALKSYVTWLQDMFLQPKLESLVDFSTSNQKKNQDASTHVPERAVFRLRKWIVLRLVSIVDNSQVEKEEAMVEEIARFCLFHSFFETKKPTSQIPETQHRPSFPLESRTREVVCSAFFSLLQALSTQVKQVPGQTSGRQSWTNRLVQFTDTLLNQNHNVAPVTPFTVQQRQAWDRMLQTLKALETRSAEVKAMAFQHLLLLVGIHLLKSPAESCDLLGDIQTCIEKSLDAKPRRTRSKAVDSQEPPWVEVLVEILLSLLAQPSHLMRQVARSVFGHVCSHLTPRALQLILDVLNPDKNQDEDDNVIVTDDSEDEPQKTKAEKNKDRDTSDSEEDEEDGSDEEDEEESDEEARDRDVDQGFREQLMAVLQAGKALGGVDCEDEEEEELGDEAMMALDQNLASLFAEQKLRMQAKQQEENKLQKEKALRRDFQIRVLDLVEVLVTKQPENPLVLELLEPLLTIIRRSMRTSSSKQEQDLLHKTARIFTHHLCRARHYCHDVGNHVEALHAQVERLVQQAGRQADSSIAFYYFNASLYLLRVLKGNTASVLPVKTPKKQKASTKATSPEATSCLDLERVTVVYSAALSSFLTKRNSSLTVPMFLSLFCRHPVLCKNLLSIMVQHVTGPVRPRQQDCLLLQKSLSMGELKQLFTDSEWEQLISQVLAKVTENLRALGTAQTKPEQQLELSSLELLITLLKTTQLQKLTVDLTAILALLKSLQQSLQESLQQGAHSVGSSRLYDLYWQAMKFLGVQRPKSEKKDAKETPSDPQSPVSMKRKKKGFLPETKKRKKRKPEATTEQDAKPVATSENQPPSSGKRRRHRKRAKASAQSQADGKPAAKSPTANTPSTGPSTSAAPTESPSAPAKTPKLQKKQQKLSQRNGTPATEPAGKKPQKGASAKSLEPTPPRKKTRLSMANGSPSLLRSGTKKKTLRFTISSSKK